MDRTAAFTTVDTNEAVTAPALPADDRSGGGYDWMDTLGHTGWRVLPSWGSEGWDAGAWPQIILCTIRTRDAVGELFGVGTYTEGDTTVRYYRSREAHRAAVTGDVFFHWKNGQSDGPPDLPATADDLPGRYRVPYTGS